MWTHLLATVVEQLFFKKFEDDHPIIAYLESLGAVEIGPDL